VVFARKERKKGVCLSRQQLLNCSRCHCDNFRSLCSGQKLVKRAAFWYTTYITFGFGYSVVRHFGAPSLIYTFLWTLPYSMLFLYLFSYLFILCWFVDVDNECSFSVAVWSLCRRALYNRWSAACQSPERWTLRRLQPRINDCFTVWGSRLVWVCHSTRTACAVWSGRRHHDRLTNWLSTYYMLPAVPSFPVVHISWPLQLTWTQRSFNGSRRLLTIY